MIAKRIHEALRWCEAAQARVTDVRIGLGYTAVRIDSESAGVAYTPRGDLTRDSSVLHAAGSLAGRPVRDLLSLLESSRPLQRTIGLAAANALAAARPPVAAAGCREVALLGPSTPLLPEAFVDTPVTWLSGIRIENPEKVLRVVSEGGGTRHFSPYVQKVNLRLPGRGEEAFAHSRDGFHNQAGRIARGDSVAREASRHPATGGKSTP